MLKRHFSLLVICLACMFGLLLMQGYWIKKMFIATHGNFEKEINLAFENSINEEFKKRCDHIELQISNKLMDTSMFIIMAHKDRDSSYFYSVANAQNPKDVSNGMVMSNINIPIIPGDTINKRTIVNGIAKMIRVADLETRTIYYRTQQLGDYVDFLIKKNGFNIKELKKIYDEKLMSTNIKVPYQFVFSSFKKKANEDQYQTRSFSTYNQIDKQTYILAKFDDPFEYVARNMVLGLVCSLMLVFGIGFCLIYLLKSLFREKKLSDVKSDFISNITHEFKTPIATIAVAIEALTSFDVLKDEKKTHRYLGHAKGELERLSNLVDQVLTIALYQNKNIELQTESVNLNQVLSEVIRLQQLSTLKRVKFRIEAQQLELVLRVNRVQFYHALNNILDNAIKYAENEVQIVISTMVSDGFLMIKITDNGFGIKNEELPLVFEQFYRSPTVLNKSLKGYGLGLNYVKYIMDHHKGWCKVESVLGQGSSFTLAWPI